LPCGDLGRLGEAERPGRGERQRPGQCAAENVGRRDAGLREFGLGLRRLGRREDGRRARLEGGLPQTLLLVGCRAGDGGDFRHDLVELRAGDDGEARRGEQRRADEAGRECELVEVGLRPLARPRDLLAELVGRSARGAGLALVVVDEQS